MMGGGGEGREGAGIRPRVTDMVMVLYTQLLYCTAPLQSQYMQREEWKERRRKEQ